MQTNAIYPPMLKQMGKQMLVSLCLFIGLFVILALVEWFCPTLSGRLLRWSNSAFIIGIPASIIGVGYTLTIRDARNYLGFYPGIVMALLLAWQFYRLGKYDLTALYIFIYIPFLTASLVKWRQMVLYPNQAQDNTHPAFLNQRSMLVVCLLSALLIAADYIVATRWINHDQMNEHIALKLISGIMIAASFFANFLIIFKKNDAWIHWVLYSLSGLALNIILGNIFLIVLFTVFFIINVSAQVAWIRNTPTDSFGWIGDKERMEKHFNKPDILKH